MRVCAGRVSVLSRRSSVTVRCSGRPAALQIFRLLGARECSRTGGWSHPLAGLAFRTRCRGRLLDRPAALPHIPSSRMAGRWLMATAPDLRPKGGETEKITVNLGYVDLGHID